MTTDRPFEIGLFTFGEITADPQTGRPLADTARSIELLATEVLPAVRRETGGRLARTATTAASGRP